MSFMAGQLRRLAVALLCCCVPACKSAPAAEANGQLPPVESGARDGAAVTSASKPARIPLGRWRLVDPKELRNVVLWLSHVLVRHSEVLPRAMSFSQGEWDAAPAPPQRSREEALALANTVAAEARARPDGFAELVERYSEDPSTRPYGGSLGGIIASQFGQWSSVLDALSSATSDGITPVVETEYGFHVFKRSPPPEPVTLTGAHIVIGYSEASWLQNQKCKEISQRSREQAWEMAIEVLRRLKDEPFEHLVEQYSEHCDARVGGDLGTWSNREPTHLPMEVQVLQGLSVGEVAAPMDSKVGVQIIKRMPNRKRGQYAMDPIYLGFDPSAADQHASSRLSVQRDATSVARELARDPSTLVRGQQLSAARRSAGSARIRASHAHPHRMGLGVCDRPAHRSGDVASAEAHPLRVARTCGARPRVPRCLYAGSRLRRAPSSRSGAGAGGRAGGRQPRRRPSGRRVSSPA
jgi:hypothetical protein